MKRLFSVILALALLLCLMPAGTAASSASVAFRLIEKTDTTAVVGVYVKSSTELMSVQVKLDTLPTGATISSGEIGTAWQSVKCKADTSLTFNKKFEGEALVSGAYVIVASPYAMDLSTEILAAEFTLKLSSSFAGGSVTGQAELTKDGVNAVSAAVTPASIENGTVPHIDKGYIGLQRTAASGGKCTLRFIGALDSRAYVEAGFRVTVKNGASSETKEILADKLMSAINAGGTSVTAASLGADYLFAAKLASVPTTASVTVTPFWRAKDGSRVYGTEVTVSSLPAA